MEEVLGNSTSYIRLWIYLMPLKYTLKNNLNKGSSAGKGRCHQTLWPEFNPLEPTYWRERTNACKLLSGIHIHTMVFRHPHIMHNIQNKYVLFLKSWNVLINWFKHSSIMINFQFYFFYFLPHSLSIILSMPCFNTQFLIYLGYPTLLRTSPASRAKGGKCWAC